MAQVSFLQLLRLKRLEAPIRNLDDAVADDVPSGRSHSSSSSCSSQPDVIVIVSPEPDACPLPQPDGAPAAYIQMPVSDCRICLSGEETEGTLVMPCACIGSVACTHLSCLERWVAERCSTTCELCGQPYKEAYATSLKQAMAAARAAKDKQQTALSVTQQQEAAIGRTRLKLLAAWVLAVVLGAALACVLMAVVRRYHDGGAALSPQPTRD